MWSSGASDAGAREQPRQLEATRRTGPSISAETVRQAVERNASFTELKRAVCPKRLPDLYREIEAYPAIAALQSLQYVTVTNDSSRGTYDKVIEVTPAGRFELMDDLRDEGEQYVIKIARRKYVIGSEHVAGLNGQGQLGANDAEVRFSWTWQPLNKAGSRFTLMPLRSDNVYHGWATFKKGETGWTLLNLKLEDDQRDYMQSQ